MKSIHQYQVQHHMNIAYHLTLDEKEPDKKISFAPSGDQTGDLWVNRLLTMLKLHCRLGSGRHCLWTADLWVLCSFKVFKILTSKPSGPRFESQRGLPSKFNS